MTTETIQKAVAAYFAALRAMDVDAWVATFAADGVSQDPVGSPPVKGHAALRQLAINMWGTWDNIGLQEQEIFVSGNEAAVKWTGHGRAKNGREARFGGIDIITVNDQGKIQSMRGYWEPARVMTQIA
jgi:steroid delta-isomerase